MARSLAVCARWSAKLTEKELERRGGTSTVTLCKEPAGGQGGHSVRSLQGGQGDTQQGACRGASRGGRVGWGADLEGLIAV